METLHGLARRYKSGDRDARHTIFRRFSQSNISSTVIPLTCANAAPVRLGPREPVNQEALLPVRHRVFHPNGRGRVVSGCVYWNVEGGFT